MYKYSWEPSKNCQQSWKQQDGGSNPQNKGCGELIFNQWKKQYVQAGCYTQQKNMKEKHYAQKY